MQLAQDVAPRKDAYLTVTEIAELLDCHPTTVRDLICRGDLPAYRPGSRTYRITPEAFLSYLDRQGYDLEQRARLQHQMRSCLSWATR